MKGFITCLALALSTLPNVEAHYRFTSLITGGTTTTAYQYVRQNTNYNSPILSYLIFTDFRCNAGGGTGTATFTATVAAGATVGFALDQAIFHPGVLNVYMSKAPGTAAAYDGSGGWFKIYQVTAVTNGGTSITWPTDNATQFTFKIPSSISAGNYLLRIEHIALHSASSTAGAQTSIRCAQLTVTGGGSASPATVSIPGVYSATDPG
ncbi:glycoside hydrolase family 61 protein, partial [Serendipita vermifera MAFF 305830]